MRLAERVKIFTGEDTNELEDAYANWFDELVEARAAIPALKGNPIKILERSLTIRNYEGEETYALAIFFEDVLLEDFERGKDRGRHLNNGVSMMVGKRR